MLFKNWKHVAKMLYQTCSKKKYLIDSVLLRYIFFNDFKKWAKNNKGFFNSFVRNCCGWWQKNMATRKPALKVVETRNCNMDIWYKSHN